MRQLLSRKIIRGIALSGFGMEEDVRKSKEAGFIEHLTKPVNLHHLEAVIRRVWQQTPAGGEQATEPSRQSAD
jgi:CheY-like chemotaxis protein